MTNLRCVTRAELETIFFHKGYRTPWNKGGEVSANFHNSPWSCHETGHIL